MKKFSLVLLLVLAACQTHKPAPEAKPAAAPAPEPAPAPVEPAPAPAQPAAPALSPAEAKRQAQTLALRAAALLDEGKEADARTALRSALALDPKNELASMLVFCMDVDPEKELGTKFFRYTVKPGDTLSKIAEQFLKEQYKFYLLARYNGIAIPRSLKADQVIKVPGTKPAVAAAAAPAAAPAAARPEEPAARPAATEVRPIGKLSPAEILQDCRNLWAAGEKDRALARCQEALAANPKDVEARATLERYRADLLQSYDRKAREAYRRQDLDECIKLWGRVLQLDPGQDAASRERDRCVRLKAELEKPVK